MRVRLVQLPAIPSLGVYPTYRLAAGVQELIRRQFLDAKGGAATAVTAAAEQQDAGKLPLRSSLSPPPPTVIAFTPSPTYTLGRRQTSATLTATDLAGLRAPLTVCPSRSGNDDGDGDGNSDRNGDENVGSTTFTPAVEEAPRGGLMTYHGPGQAVLWPIFDLKAPAHRQFTVRAYSRLLETVTAEVLQKRFGLAAYTTPDAGLWVRSPGRGSRGAGGDAEEQKEEEEERKIAALGVHLRRNIAALGVAVNLNTPVTRYGGVTEPLSSSSPANATELNPWVRFVPCGIGGKGVSSVADEGRLRFGRVPAAWDLDPVPFAAQWAAAFAVHLGLEPDVDVADREAVTQFIDQAKKRLYAAAQREAAER
ncbi:biotin/lipoate A/B protein ligase [Niveomyces insectorum RCEF 264]|uniref:Biotin/lipoate A/B protein ligase n=1 Tax=Niveomyces insectorum RCEF 264 TaxID=1081102 RepID=A0A162JCK9_9HYPO|nr:biotin/lipoate A/B protein ligase [Niveomyces insectorum RCEF 264]